MNSALLSFGSNSYSLSEAISIPPFWRLSELAGDSSVPRGLVRIGVLPIPERGKPYAAHVPAGDALAAIRRMHIADRAALDWLARGEKECQRRKNVALIGWFLARTAETEYLTKSPELEKACRRTTRAVLLLVDQHATGEDKKNSQHNLHHFRHIVGR